MKEEEDLDKLPLFDLEVGELEDVEWGVKAISFVDGPATRVKWFKFTDHYFKVNEMEQIVTAPIMLADTPIPRYHPSLGKFYVQFTKDNIQKMMKKYFMSGNMNNVNENHNPEKIVDNVYLIESFITGEKVSSNLYSDIPDGSWMGSFYVKDSKYWNDVVMSDTFNGFSLEGKFIDRLVDLVVEKRFSSIEKILESDLDEEIQFQAIKKIINEYEK